MKYQFLDLGNMPLPEVAFQQQQLLTGCIAVNTSFDSGLFVSSWQEVNGYCVSPKITLEFIQTWPVSHEEYCDEWWIFEREIPSDFKVHAFCNYVNLRIADYKDLESLYPLDLYLEKFHPVAILGNKEATYLIRRQD